MAGTIKELEESLASCERRKRDVQERLYEVRRLVEEAEEAEGNVRRELIEAYRQRNSGK